MGLQAFMERPSCMTLRWPQDAVAAVSLTFDGGTPGTLAVRDGLHRHGTRATFYVDAPTLLGDIEGWRRASQAGHELGNHALLGACDDDGLIARMSQETLREEVAELEDLLRESFTEAVHSAALPLVKTWTDDAGIPSIPDVIQRTIVRLNEEALLPILSEQFGAIRTPGGRFFSPSDSLHELPSCRVDGFDSIAIGLIAQIAISQKAWVILSSSDPDPASTMQIVKWLSRQPVWVAPVIEVAQFVRLARDEEPSLAR